jgi:hypothetical protein
VTICVSRVLDADLRCRPQTGHLNGTRRCPLFGGEADVVRPPADVAC